MADKNKEPSQLERISSEVHDAWVEWAKHISRRVKPVWRERWKKLYVDYEELPEVEKKKDRVFARKIQKVVKSSACPRELGKSIGIEWRKEQYKPKDLREGMQVEEEHGPGAGDPRVDVTKGSKKRTAQIALAHLEEDPDYYEKLEKMESGSQKSGAYRLGQLAAKTAIDADEESYYDPKKWKELKQKGKIEPRRVRDAILTN